jgi:hypothetical protein
MILPSEFLLFADMCQQIGDACLQKGDDEGGVNYAQISENVLREMARVARLLSPR